MGQGSFQLFTANAETAIISASDIEILVGSDDSKNKGGGTVNVFFRQHPTAEWSTVKQFTAAGAIEDFKANSKYGGQYKITLTGSTTPDLQISWRI